MTDSVSKEKIKPMRKLFQAAVVAQLSVARLQMKFAAIVMKADELTESGTKTLAAEVEAKLERKFNKIAAKMEVRVAEVDAGFKKAEEKAVKKGLTQADVDFVFQLIQEPARALEFFGKDVISKAELKEMKKCDKVVEKFSGQPFFKAYYAK